MNPTFLMNFGGNFLGNFFDVVLTISLEDFLTINLDAFYLETVLTFTAKRKLERLQFSTSSSFVKIRSACSCEFKAYF